MVGIPSRELISAVAKMPEAKKLSQLILFQHLRCGHSVPTCQECATHSAYTMKLEHFKAIVDADPFIKLLKEADDYCRYESNSCCSPSIR